MELKVDVDMVERTLATTLGDDQLTEIRALGSRVWSAHWWGRDARAAAIAVAELVASDPTITGTYFIPNPVRPEVRWQVGRFHRLAKGAGTKDDDILCRRWLLVDLDPVRDPPELMANVFEREQTESLMPRILDELKAVWPHGGLLADSGNGCHCLLPLADWPSEDNGACAFLLKLLARKYNNDHVKVDVKVANPSRIVKLYGTPVKKGPWLPDRPWRLSRLYPLESARS